MRFRLSNTGSVKTHKWRAWVGPLMQKNNSSNGTVDWAVFWEGAGWARDTPASGLEPHLCEERSGGWELECHQSNVYPRTLLCYMHAWTSRNPSTVWQLPIAGIPAFQPEAEPIFWTRGLKSRHAVTPWSKIFLWYPSTPPVFQHSSSGYNHFHGTEGLESLLAACINTDINIIPRFKMFNTYETVTKSARFDQFCTTATIGVDGLGAQSDSWINFSMVE